MYKNAIEYFTIYYASIISLHISAHRDSYKCQYKTLEYPRCHSVYINMSFHHNYMNGITTGDITIRFIIEKSCNESNLAFQIENQSKL